jgi:hypothetical protein
METSLSGKSTGLLSRRGSTHAHNDRGKRPDSSPVACAWDDQRQSPAPYPYSCSRLGAQLGQPKRWSCAFHAMGARQNRVAECDADLHAAGSLGDREPPFPLEVAQRADRLKRLPQRSRPRTPPGDGGYDEGLGERGRRDPVRRGLLLGSRSGRPSPVRTQALMAQVPESARIRPLLRWQQEPQRWPRAGGSCSAAPNDRLETDKTVTPSTKPLQIGNPRICATDAPDGRVGVTSQRQTPCK